MKRTTLLTAAAGIGGSLLVSALLWIYFDTFLFFLFIPFVPFLFRKLGGKSDDQPTTRECPQCGFQTVNDDYEYCPRDGRRLRKRAGRSQQEGEGWS